MSCARGHTCQFAMRAGMNMSAYFLRICGPSRPSIIPIEPMNSPSPMGAITSWSAATRFDSARMLTLLAPPLLVGGPRKRNGKLRSRKKFHRPIRGPMPNPNAKNLKVRGTSYRHRSARGPVHFSVIWATRSPRALRAPLVTARVPYGWCSKDC